MVRNTSYDTNERRCKMGKSLVNAFAFVMALIFMYAIWKICVQLSVMHALVAVVFGLLIWMMGIILGARDRC
ncbi:MAG: hypothetical protein WAQ25_02685 [Candidatus Saccharimonas sp.]